MSGPADLPEGFALDPTPAEDMTLGDVLATAETPQTVLQDFVEASLQMTSEPGPGLARVITSDTLEFVRGAILELAGRHVGHYPMWLRFWRPDLDRGLLVVLSSPNPYGEVDLAIVAHPGVLNRTILRALFRWAFYAAGWSRVVARVPADRRDLADLLRRAGFKHEGVARGGLPHVDAQLWALTAHDALWLLPHSQRPIPALPEQDVSPPKSMKVH